eukprot:4360837-Karenia_brevis.AAC.1
MGNTFHFIAVAYLLGSWAMLTGYSLEHPSLPRLWAQAGYAYDSAEDPDHPDHALRGIAKIVVNPPGAERDPG